MVDLQLRKAGDQASLAPFLSLDSFGSRGAEIDAQLPLAGKQLGLVAGIRVIRKDHDLASTLIAILVGGLVTFGPLALLYSA